VTALAPSILVWNNAAHNLLMRHTAGAFGNALCVTLQAATRVTVELIWRARASFQDRIGWAMVSGAMGGNPLQRRRR